MLKGIIFDMDGVLVDNREPHIEAFVIQARRYGLELDTSNPDWMYGKGNDGILPRLLPAELIEKEGLEKLSDEKEKIYRDIYADTIEPVAGLIPLLKDLRTHGMKVAVGSSGPKENVDFVLDKLGIRDMFDVVVNGDMVIKRKPDPEIFLLSAEMLGLEPTECLIFEDSFVGLEAAGNAGIKAIALATTFPREKVAEAHNGLIINDFTEITFGQIEREFN